MGRYANIDQRRRRDGSVSYRLRVNAAGHRVVEEFATEAAALARRAEVYAALRGGVDPPAPPTPEAHVRDAPASVHDVARLLVRGIASGEVRTREGASYKPSVLRGYERELRRHVLPELGALPIRELARRDVQQLVDRVALEASPEIARKTLTAFRVVCRLALARDLIETNPCVGVRPTLAEEREARQPRVLEPHETVRLLRAATADDVRMGRSLAVPLIRLALDAGLRSGEILGLRWGRDDADLASSTIRIRASLDRERDASGRYPHVRAKSSASRRDIPIAPELVAVLRRHRAASPHDRDGDLVLADDRGDPLVVGGKPRATWYRVVASARLDDPQPRFHDLRHAYATHLLATGVGPHAVAKLLGHADAGLVWRRYGHALPSEISSAADRLQAWREQAGGDS